MPRCEDCIHNECCSIFIPIRVALCDDDADKKCELFKSAADVVPKSEYDRLEKLFNDMTQEAKGYLNRLYGIRAEVAREIFEEIEEYAELQIESLNIAEKVDSRGADFFGGGKQAFVLLLDRLAELKKKYTEGEKV